jgi:putative endonuclease
VEQLQRNGDDSGGRCRRCLRRLLLVRVARNNLYTGSTNNLAARELAHNQGRGAKYTAGRRPVRIVYSEVHESRSAAQARESQLKCWTRARKEALVAGASDRPKRL